jgi:hypothetical protein
MSTGIGRLHKQFVTNAYMKSNPSRRKSATKGQRLVQWFHCNLFPAETFVTNYALVAGIER